MIPGRAHPYRDRRAVAATHRDQRRTERRRDRRQKTVNNHPREETRMADDASPERYRAPETPDEHLAELQARRGGEPPPKLETEAYRRHRADALRAAGLDDEADELDPAREPDPESEGVDAHLNAIRSKWHR